MAKESAQDSSSGISYDDDDDDGGVDLTCAAFATMFDDFLEEELSTYIYVLNSTYYVSTT